MTAFLTPMVGPVAVLVALYLASVPLPRMCFDTVLVALSLSLGVAMVVAGLVGSLYLISL